MHSSDKSHTNIAFEKNHAVIKRVDKDASRPGAVLGPCIAAYGARLTGQCPPRELLANLTAPLVDAFTLTRSIIEQNMQARWRDDPSRVQGSVANSLRRSAGTNYQTLVSYALAQYLVSTSSAWFVEKPVPKEFRQALAITFTGGIPLQPEEDQETRSYSNDGTAGDEYSEQASEAPERDTSQSIVQVQPDVDILLRNAGWVERQNEAEPVVLLSVKTSLVDRAGMAARWKIYFDQVTHPCPYQDRPDCAYRQLGISMDNADKYEIYHGIVTANIYKLNCTTRLRQLRSGGIAR